MEVSVERKKTTKRKKNKSKSISNSTIGEFLKGHREKNKMELQSISEKIKIRTSILKEIEHNNLKALPVKPYVQGFVRSYSEYLGVNTEEAIEILEKTYELYAKETTDKTQVEYKNMLDEANQKELPIITARKTSERPTTPPSDKLTAIVGITSALVLSYFIFQAY